MVGEICVHDGQKAAVYCALCRRRAQREYDLEIEVKRLRDVIAYLENFHDERIGALESYLAVEEGR